ncbi:MAG TPA: phage tail tube protein [Pirellulales bacterium]|nr:phage tail tube protein [Pirellulales bacterium]
MPFVSAVVIPTEDTRVQVEGATPGTFTDIAGLEQFDGPNSEAAEVKKTNLQSQVQETRGSLIPDNGELSFSLQGNPTDTTQTQLQADQATGMVRNYRIILNTQSATTRPYFQFGAWVKTYNRKGGEAENNWMADVVLRVTTPITTGSATAPFSMGAGTVLQGNE